MVSRDEILMGRDGEFPLSAELEANLADLLTKVNQFRAIYNIPMTVSSGYRPGYYNTRAGGAKNSNHQYCQAVDFHDSDGTLDQYCLDHPEVLEQCGLYQEDPAHTIGWTHLQSVAPKSGHRVFIP